MSFKFFFLKSSTSISDSKPRISSSPWPLCSIKHFSSRPFFLELPPPGELLLVLGFDFTSGRNLGTFLTDAGKEKDAIDRDRPLPEKRAFLALNLLKIINDVVSKIDCIFVANCKSKYVVDDNESNEIHLVPIKFFLIKLSFIWRCCLASVRGFCMFRFLIFTQTWHIDLVNNQLHVINRVH